ncbi:unnamed protein product [Closterium sp. NIES-65]|nr:unnamed protein product [Closterium sp. NIES-65]
MEMFAVLFKLVLPNTRISRILFPSKLQGAHSSYVSTPCRYYVPSASSLRLRPPSPLPTLRSLRTLVPPPHSAMSFAATAATLRRELQQQRARQLYRRSLKNTLSWAIFRDIYYDEADKLRALFEANRHEKATFPFFRLLLLIVPSLPHFRLPLSATPPGQSDPDRIDRLLAAGEAKLKENQHPDPYLGVQESLITNRKLKANLHPCHGCGCMADSSTLATQPSLLPMGSPPILSASIPPSPRSPSPMNLPLPTAVPWVWVYGGSKYARNATLSFPHVTPSPSSPPSPVPPAPSLPSSPPQCHGLPWVYGGSKYARNPPFPQEISIVHGFGKEEH